MDAFLPFIMGVGVLGGLLALLLVIIRPLTAYLFSKLEKPPTISRILTVGEPVPYGVAIAISFLILLWSAKIPGIVL
jgi:Flp pilus assembly protein protease CpaA